MPGAAFPTRYGARPRRRFFQCADAPSSLKGHYSVRPICSAGRRYRGERIWSSRLFSFY